MNQNVILGRVGGWVEVGSKFRVPHLAAFLLGCPPLCPKRCHFLLDTFTEGRKNPFVWISCVACRKVVGSISFPSEAAKEFLVRHSSVL